MRAAAPILDADDPRVAAYRGLRGPDAIVRRQGFVAEGVVVLEKAIASGRYPLRSVLVSERRRDGLDGLLQRLPDEVALYVAAQPVLDAVCGFPVHRGVLAFGDRPALPSPAGLLAALPSRAVVVCPVGVNDPDNMGAIYRNAAAFGAAAVLLDASACDPFYRRAIRVSVGAVLTLPSARLEPGDDLPALLARHGFEPLALSPSGATPLKAMEVGPRTALLLGAEGPGLPVELMARTRTVSIPMAAGFDSLNVAAASAVALHHLLA